MPSRTLTKRVKYLRRQQEISKNAKRKARRVRTHKHNKSVKRNKKVMRGGNIGNGMYTAYVLYDEIPRPNVVAVPGWYGAMIHVPICVIIFHPVKFSLDNIYLFFNNEATSDDMLSMVKLLLGIKGEFSLDPPIITKETTEEEEKCEDCFLKRTFIKLERCQSRIELLKQGNFTSKLTYCVKSMDINLWWRQTVPNLLWQADPMTVKKLIDVIATLDKNVSSITREGHKLVEETKHEIVTADETYKDLDEKKIREQLEKKSGSKEYFRDGQSVFVNSVKESNACLPNLYKEFFKPKNPIPPQYDDDYSKDEYFNLFYKEYYTERENEETLPSNFPSSYDDHKKDIKSKIVADLKNRNKTYRLDDDSYKKLEKDRPLRISEPFNYRTNPRYNDAQIFVEAEWLLSSFNPNKPGYFPKRFINFSYRKKWYEEMEKEETDKVKEEITQMQINRYGQPPTSPTP